MSVNPVVYQFVVLFLVVKLNLCYLTIEECTCMVFQWPMNSCKHSCYSDIRECTNVETECI